MELADVTDSKSVGSDTVWVRVPPPAPDENPFTKWADFRLYYSLFIIHHSLFIKKTDFRMNNEK